MDEKFGSAYFASFYAQKKSETKTKKTKKHFPPDLDFPLKTRVYVAVIQQLYT
jgi:hypothetical protein